MHTEITAEQKIVHTSVPTELRMARQFLTRAGVSFRSSEDLAETLPFSRGDVTAGSESELQAVVIGSRSTVDLPLTIEQSNYFANIQRRVAAGEVPRKAIADLERFISDNPTGVWENSWVRFPGIKLSEFARGVFQGDLLADKKKPDRGTRCDIQRFCCTGGDGVELLRLPVSYLIKLALADLIGTQPLLPPLVRETGIRLMGHYLNDNTSPETFSFNVVTMTPDRGMGREIARETALRFLFTQLLVTYANEAFGLAESSQKAKVYFAPHPPVRQKELNDLVSDSFYRELFMSPCLSGWDKGEEKYRYMQLCHQVLSRSQLNAVAKLREAGIITTNLVVLPNVSNVSLANNGTHLSIGSRRLTAALGDPSSGFTAHHEKQLGDLAVKISEHFLPLFVGTYSAAPYRLAFSDFHPEKALGFLPHELDYTHLRMFWRRWKRKADISIFGQPVTPFGPNLLDSAFSRVFGLSGDFVPDYRLLDYLVCLLSTDRCPSLNGAPGNHDRLRADLTEMGVFDEQMSVYLLYKQREFAKMGFSGFEGRHYSLFESFRDDMSRAADLQTLVTALAFKYMALGSITHAHIPDTPSTESERRQIFFGSAIGIPTFFVRRDTSNLFMSEIIKRTPGVRPSRRYSGYLRVPNGEFRSALVKLLKEDGAELIEMLDLHETINDLERRIAQPDLHTAAGKLTRGILEELGSGSARRVPAREFNVGAEQYYRETLCRKHLDEALDFLAESCLMLDEERAERAEPVRSALHQILGEKSMAEFLGHARHEIFREHPDTELLKRFLNLMMVVVHADGTASFSGSADARSSDEPSAPVYRAG